MKEVNIFIISKGRSGYMGNGRIELKIGDTYRSLNYGDFTIISVEEKNGKQTRRATIQFKDTGAIHTASIFNILRGNVRDKSVPIRRTDNVIIDFDKVYQSKNYGAYKIIVDEGKGERGTRMVRIRFIDTGYENVVTYSNAVYGTVRDHIVFDKRNAIDYDKIYQSKNYGPFKILRQVRSKNGSRRVEIQFINTGAISEVYVSSAKLGQVRDPSVESVKYKKKK